MTNCVPNFTLPNGTSVSIFDPKVVETFSLTPPAAQRKTIRILEAFLDELRLDGSPEHLLAIGVLLHGQDELLNQSPERKALVKHQVIDRTCWQLAQLLKYSKPTRIGEAVPHLTYIIEAYRHINPSDDKVDLIPWIFLGVALVHSGDHKRALETLQDTLKRVHRAIQMPVKNLLWARVHLAWLLREEGRVQEAEEQESLTRNWILAHPYAYPPVMIKAAITEDSIPGVGAHVVDDTDIAQYLTTRTNSAV